MLDQLPLHDRRVQPDGLLQGAQERARTPCPTARQGGVVDILGFDPGREKNRVHRKQELLKVDRLDVPMWFALPRTSASARMALRWPPPASKKTRSIFRRVMFAFHVGPILADQARK